MFQDKSAGIELLTTLTDRKILVIVFPFHRDETLVERTVPTLTSEAPILLIQRRACPSNQVSHLMFWPTRHCLLIDLKCCLYFQSVPRRIKRNRGHPRVNCPVSAFRTNFVNIPAVPARTTLLSVLSVSPRRGLSFKASL